MVISLGAAGCATSVYEYNLQHAYVAPAAGLSQEETEQVIWAVSHLSLRLIISVTKDPKENKVVVTTSNAEEGLMIYILRKGDNGRWRIVHYYPSPTMAL